jgi:hypothetical protein
MVFCRNIFYWSILDAYEMQRENQIMKLIEDFALCIFLVWPTLFFVSGCATNETKPPGRGRIHPSAYAADNMTFNKPQVQREPQSFEFYYKHCQVDERTPPPRGAIWECTEP